MKTVHSSRGLDQRRHTRRRGAFRAAASATVGAVVVSLALAGAGVAHAAAPASGVPAAVPAVIPDGSLLAHYDFDGDPLTSGTVVDRTGHGLDATIVNTAQAALEPGSASGSTALTLPGGAWNSNGAYVSLPKTLIAGKSDITVSARVKLNSSTQAWQWLFGIGTNTTQYIFTTPKNSDGFLRTAVTTNGPGAEAQVTGSAALPLGQWTTVTVTLDSAAHSLTTYLDGVAVGSATTSVDATQLIANSATVAGYIGKSFYNDPLFAGSIDDFSVYGIALSADQVTELVDGAVPTVDGLAQTAFDVRTTVGTAPALPATATAHYSDGFDRPVPIAWDAVDPAAYAQRGSFTVNGTAAGEAVTATVKVIVAGELSIDLSSDTGAFHGGASGTLYGLYGPGIPSDNLIEGMGLRTVATKAQDGPQHPGADALEVVQPLANATNGDVYIYMTDINRGFPYEWEGDTPAAKLSGYMDKMATQVDQVLQLPADQQDNIVFVPFNEPEGNMFGTGQWSYDGVSWLDNPADYFAAWDAAYRMIKQKMPSARIAGPNTSVLFSQVEGFLQHAVAENTVPDVMTWHELSNPANIRNNVPVYRAMEQRSFAGTAYEGRQLPINIDEYAFNYHTSVPGQMIQWISAIEDSKVDADIAYWNIDGNLSDSAVQSNRGNGQWWLLNAYSQMSGHTVSVDPPSPDQSYTLQGVATLDESKAQARAIFGGASGNALVSFDHVDPAVFGDRVHASIQRIDWSGQVGDSAGPAVVSETDAVVTGGSVDFDFGGSLPALDESSAYEIVLTPGANASDQAVAPTLWKATYEAEDAAHTGSGYSKNGVEGSPADVSKFYTSGGYDVGGLRTGSNVTLDFPVDVPQAGSYDLSVFANSLNTYGLVADQGPTNVFLTVDGGAEQEIFLPLGYKWVVWDHTDTTVDLTAGAHTIRLAAKSLDGTKGTKGDAIVDKIDLSLANPAAADRLYEAEYASLDGATTDYSHAGVSASGVASVGAGQSATFWVYSAREGESILGVDTLGGGTGTLTVNGNDVATVGDSTTATVFLDGGVNKVTVTGTAGSILLDRLRVQQSDGALASTEYEAESAVLAGTATATPLSLASGGLAVTGVGGAPGNGNTLTFDHVTVDKAGTYALTVRFSNQEQSPATHYNPDPLARPADISVNGAAPVRVLFPHSFHQNDFWEQTVDVQLQAGVNTIRFSSQEKTNFDGTSYISDTFPGVLLRSQYAPNIDKIRVTPIVADSTPEPQPVVVDRIAGADRFEVAVNTSKAGFPDGASTVFVASGAVFPDALSAAPAATVADAPILLTASGSLPGVVRDEIVRLHPDKIVIVGGVNTVSSTVETALAALAPVSRIGGADRFEASRNIAAAAFPNGAPVAVLAAGANFPDALSAGAAVAGRGPVILVNGGASGLDDATKALLGQLGVTEIAIAGGPNSVSDGIQSDAAAIAATVRLGGADRYAASRAITAHFATTADRVLLATGEKFPDALAGSAFGPKVGAPLLTVPGTCVPAETLAQITALGATKVTLLGGPNTLAEGVESLTACR
ncbi:cell wall-binding repeat-containing protein [Herbiconiux sp. 11R-BC]|uniref:cell wall-binding repeat-containing protein n=1 Tax=Herbiconiux sp. 11R-BC TaxID=3111637 RepID=UPI003C092BB9